MRDASKGRKQGRNLEQPEKQVWLTAAEFAKCLGVTARAARNGCKAGLYPGSRLARMNGGEGWQIPLNCLPPSAQIAWHERQRKERPAKVKPARTNGRDNVSPNETAAVPVAANDQAYRDALWDAFWKATEGQREEATRRAEIVHEYNRLAGNGAPEAEILAALGVSRATMWRYREKVKGQDTTLWAPLLLPEWKGKTHRAEFTEEAWQYIQDQYLIQSQPSLKAVYRRALKIAPENEWIIPSYDTVSARIEALPHNFRVWKREGNRALALTFAHQERDYSALELHEVWCSDGHKADVFVKDKAGEVFRPIVVAWQELRSRRILGWAVGKSETADLVRRALHKSIVACGNAIPRRALMDNGMAFAAKENTGGAATRYRNKIKEDEIPGTMTLLGIEPQWATPGHGQAKPIESAWRVLTEMAKRKEFNGAYCGNKPDAKPENFNEKNAVPLAEFLRILKETLSSYNARAHRGNSMHGKSPNQVYESLLPAIVPHQVTDIQLRFVLLAAEPVRLDRQNGSFTVLKNRYWSERCSELARKPGYSARYDPDNLEAPVYLFLNERYLFEVPLIAKTGFNNRAAAKEHGKRKRSHMASVKKADEDRAKLWEAENSNFGLMDEAPDQETEAMPKPKIVKPVRLPVQLPPSAEQKEEEENTPLIGPGEFAELLAKKYSQKGS